MKKVLLFTLFILLVVSCEEYSRSPLYGAYTIRVEDNYYFSDCEHTLCLKDDYTYTLYGDSKFHIKDSKMWWGKYYNTGTYMLKNIEGNTGKITLICDEDYEDLGYVPCEFFNEKYTLTDNELIIGNYHFTVSMRFNY